MSARRWIAGVLVGVALGPAGCGGEDADLVVYSGRNEPRVKPVLERYAERTGKEVRFRYADTVELAATVLEEGEEPAADVVIGQDAGALARLDEAGRLARYQPGDRLLGAFRSPTGTWTGLSARALVLMVNRDALPRSQWPSSIFDLTDPRWAGRIAAPSPTNASWIGFVSTLRIKEGEERASSWLSGMRRNELAVLGSHADVRRAVAAGEYPLGLVDHHHVELERRGGAPVRAVHTDQERDGFGTAVNAASAGIVAGGPNPEEARAFMDYLLDAETQRDLVRRTHEYPVVDGVPVEGPRPLSEIRGAGVPLPELGPAFDGTMALLDEVGLDR